MVGPEIKRFATLAMVFVREDRVAYGITSCAPPPENAALFVRPPPNNDERSWFVSHLDYKV